MSSLLPSAVLVALFGFVGLCMFWRVLGLVRAIAFVGGSLLVTTGVTALRFRVAVAESTDSVLTSDTYRYLLFGSDRWGAGQPLGEMLLSGDGTSGVIGLSQLFFTLIGGDWFSVFLAGSFVGMLGCWLISRVLFGWYGKHGSRLALLATFFPSVLYWSSSFGKEAFCFLALGSAFWGLEVALASRHGRAGVRGVLAIVAGVGVAWLVRPQVAVLIVAACVAAWIFVSDQPHPRIGWGAFLGILLASLVLLLWLSLQGALGAWTLLEDLGSRYERTSLGDTQVNSDRPPGLLGLLFGIPTALFRPFPWEAGLGGLGSSLDSLLIASTVIVAWRRRKILNTERLRSLVFALSVVFILFLPLAGYGNLGLLARMRSMTIPFVLVVAAVCDLPGASVTQPKRSTVLTSGGQPGEDGRLTLRAVRR